eukprot:1946370-Karenia_brevis.AAC.1
MAETLKSEFWHLGEQFFKPPQATTRTTSTTFGRTSNHFKPLFKPLQANAEANEIFSNHLSK